MTDMKVRREIGTAFIRFYYFLIHSPMELALVLFIVMGLWLRLQGIGFDLPNLYHPDEDAVLMPALTILKTGEWNPSRLEYGSLHIYILTAVSAVVFSLLVRDGRIPPNVDTIPIFERGTYPAVYQLPEFFLAARTVSAIMGTAAIFIIYLLGKRLGGKQVGLLAAGITAVLPFHVTDAHFATTDTPLFFWVTLALYLMVRTYDNWQQETVWAYIGAGFVAGLAMATKYNGVLLIVPLVLVAVLNLKKLEEIITFRTIAGPLGMAAGFLLGTPYALLDLPSFLSWFGYSLRLYNAPVEPAVTAWQWHLDFHLNSPHAPIFVLGLIGFLLSFFIWGKRSLLLGSFALVVWFAILNQTNYQARMWQPVSMVIILWAALVLDWVVRLVTNRFYTERWSRFVQFAPMVMMIPLMMESMTYGRNFAAGDVRTQTAVWIRENIPPGTAIGGDYFMPNLNPDSWAITKTFHVFEHDVAWYQAEGIDYVVMNEALNDFDTFSVEKKNKYDQFVAQVCLVEAINGPFLATTHFDIKIYQVPPCSPLPGQES